MMADKETDEDFSMEDEEQEADAVNEDGEEDVEEAEEGGEDDDEERDEEGGKEYGGDEEYRRKKEKVVINKKNKSGIIYLSVIPPGMQVDTIKSYFSHYGELGRTYLQPEKKLTVQKAKKIKDNYYENVKYVEGWVEFRKKKIAKRVAFTLNNTMIGGKRKSEYYDHVWSIKYLHRFKWTHLNERLAYERVSRQQRMRTEVAQAKREADFYINNVEKSERMKRYSVQNTDEEMNMRQRETDLEIRERKKFNRRPRGSKPDGPDEELLKSIFASGNS